MVCLPESETILKITRFDRIHECDRQTYGRTDRQTPHDDTGRACMASRDKNHNFRPISRIVSKTTQDRAIVTMER